MYAAMVDENELQGNMTLRGQNRKEDIAALADAIAGAVDGLCNYNESIARLNGKGDLDAISLDIFRDLIERNICGLRVVHNGTGWQREYFTYGFEPQSRPDPRVSGPRPPLDNSKPDSNVLDEIYRVELLWRVPRVEDRQPNLKTPQIQGYTQSPLAAARAAAGEKQ
jgi:hypothetical protein